MVRGAAYAAFLRGVTPINLKSADLAKAIVAAGFSEPKTVLASGNVVFRGPVAPLDEIARRAEEGMRLRMGRSFFTIVRAIDALEELLAADPYRTFRLASDAKRVVTFLPAPPGSKLSLPLELDGARILCVRGAEVFTAYTRSPRGPVFMKLIEQTFGKDVTTRTWDTIKKVVRAGKDEAG